MSIVKNEAHNYLSVWLENISKFADYHVFVDDASDDETPQIIAEHLKKHPGELHIRKTSLFRQNEPALRAELWEYVRKVAKEGDWILVVDADELYDDRLLALKKKLLKNKFPQKESVKMSFLDMWTPDSYRVDGYWSPKGAAVRAFRYHNISFGNNSKELHCPPYPLSVNTKKHIKVFVPVVHLAYLRQKDRERRYYFYTKNVSPETNPTGYQHACSILEKKPNLKAYFSPQKRLKARFLGRKIYLEIYHLLRELNSDILEFKLHKKPLYKQLFRSTVKPVLKIVTGKYLRLYLRWKFQEKKMKQFIKKIENTFPENTVLIFQNQFFDKDGLACFNGGAERYLRDLSDILTSLNYKPILVQMAGKIFWEKDVGSMHVIGIPCSNNEAYIQQIQGFSKFKFAIYSGATFWGKKLLHPNVLISHGITWDNPNKNVDVKNILNIFRDMDHFVSVDTNTISWLRTTFALTMTKIQMHYIPNYVDTKVYKPVPKNNKRVKIIFPRRASDARGYWLISPAVPPIMEKYPNVDMDFVGFAHGEEITADLKRLISQFKGRITHKVVEPSEMVSVYQNADISLIPTLFSEGTSLSCLEAQACGNVVISTNIGGLPNLVIDGYNGLLINPNGQELMKALDKVLTFSELRHKLSKNAVHVAQVFDKSIWIDRWKNVIKSIITKG